MLLHFGAVDYACAVQVNGHLVGGHPEPVMAGRVQRIGDIQRKGPVAAPQGVRLRHGKEPGRTDRPLEKAAIGNGAPPAEKGALGPGVPQVSDVEDEVNGLFTYDRAAIKPDPAAVRAVNQALKAAFEKTVE